MATNSANARQVAAPARIVRNSSVRRGMLAIIRPVLNPLILWLALMVPVYHRGRRSGRIYATPTAARPIAGGFVVPMTFGEQADWFRNLKAAGGGEIEWKGKRYPVVDPEIVDFATARDAFGRFERLMLPLLGVESFVRLRHAAAPH
jgi:deazaflavin-dependent oxidoreductase (nitroreductase family)